MTLRIETPDNDAQFELYTGANGDTDTPSSDRIPESELSDQELLAQATYEALQAQDAGILGGPALNEIQLLRARHQAQRNDTGARPLSGFPEERIA